jgi:hypothetical protein
VLYNQTSQPVATPDQQKRKSIMDLKKQFHQNVIRQVLDKDAEAASPSIKL